jgi:hydroxypyruvate reductase
MQTRHPLIIANNFHPPTIEALDAIYDTVHLWTLNEDQKRATLTSLEGRCIAAASASWATDPLLYTLDSLELISCFGVGVDGIDFAATKRCNIKVTNTPSVLDDAVADIAIGLIIACARRFVAADAFVREGKWAKGPLPLGKSLSGKTLGIAGLGRIGQEVADRAKGFKLNIAYHNRKPKDCDYAYFKTLNELARASDIVVNVLPGGPATFKLFDASFFESLGAEGIFINVGRGQSVDEAALVTALQDKRIAAAGLDVYAQEPSVPAELVAMDNVVLLPHIGSATGETRAAMGNLVKANLASYFEDRTLVSEFFAD